MEGKRIVLGTYTLLVGGALAASGSLGGVLIGLVLVALATVALVTAFGRWLGGADEERPADRAT